MQFLQLDLPEPTALRFWQKFGGFDGVATFHIYNNKSPKVLMQKSGIINEIEII